MNGFWLSHDNARHPAISLLVNRDVACLHYFPYESHPGFPSVGAIEELTPDGPTIFSLNTPEQEQEMPNGAVIHLSEAVQVAKNFLAFTELPKAIKWLEL